jgi:transketolase
VVGIATFGESAPAKDLYAHFDITAEHVSREVRRLVHAAAIVSRKAMVAA